MIKQEMTIKDCKNFLYCSDVLEILESDLLEFKKSEKLLKLCENCDKREV